MSQRHYYSHLWYSDLTHSTNYILQCFTCSTAELMTTAVLISRVYMHVCVCIFLSFVYTFWFLHFVYPLFLNYMASLSVTLQWRPVTEPLIWHRAVLCPTVRIPKCYFWGPVLKYVSVEKTFWLCLPFSTFPPFVHFKWHSGKAGIADISYPVVPLKPSFLLSPTLSIWWSQLMHLEARNPSWKHFNSAHS